MSKESIYKEKMAKVEYVVNEFLKNKKTIKEISQITGISKSSVQRYLNDVKFIKEIYGINAEFIIEEIRRRLVKNYEEGVKLGGNNFAANNESIKDDLGHFQGSINKK